MSEEQIQPQVNTEPVAPVENAAPQQTPVVEENVSQAEPTENKAETGTVEQVVDDKPTDVPNATEDIAALKKQLEEYRLRDEEVKQLADRLGTNQVQDMQLFEAQKQLDIIDNQAQQQYIALCNQYGVDYRPDKIEASANELKANNPQAFYELQNKIEKLDNAITSKRNEVNNFVRNREIDLSINKYNKILNASPMLSQQLNTYLNTAPLDNVSQQIDTFMQMAQAIQMEAFEYGKLYAQQQATQTPVNPVDTLNGSVMATNQAYAATQPKVWTRQEIANMSQAEFEKYEKDIDLAIKEGRLR